MPLKSVLLTKSKVRNPFLRMELDLTLRLAQLIDSPRSLAVALLAKAGEWQQLLDLDIDSRYYTSPQHFAEDYLVTEILSKSPNLPTGIDRKAVAVQSFLAAEERCEKTNHVFSQPETSHPVWVWSMRHTVSQILGEFNPSNLPRLCRFGPGATTSVRGHGLVPSDKFDGEIHLTHSLLPFVRPIMGDRWWEYYHNAFTVVRGSKHTVVPKNAKTDRSICIEPSLNIFVQLGLGAMIRSRLKHYSGIDLDSQDTNRRLARLAVSRKLATLDLKGASDSVAKRVVEYFLPPVWLHAMALCRSEETLMGGKWVELQKWSSMGNGYTFELETLLFYALCVQFVPHSRLGDVTVFGDDIIVPQEYAPAVIDALTYLGFEVNTKKSHLAGGFFESCGEHYFFGSNVKPFYCRLRDDPDDPDIPYAVKLANRLRAWSSQLLDGCDARYKPIWDWLVEQAPVRWRNIRVPPVLGDLGFACSMGEAELRRPDGPEAYHFGCEGYFVRSISPTTKDVCKGTLGVLLSALAAAGRTSDPNSGRWWGVDNTIPQALSRWDLMIANIHGSVDVGRPSYGRESRRGIYGRLKERWTWVIPWSGYEWVDAPRGASVIS